MQDRSLSHLICFGDFEFDTRAGELRNSTGPVLLPKQPLHVLLLLLEHPGEVVSREELRTVLWPGQTFVDYEDGLNHVVRRLREALGDSSESPRFIERIPRQGYRFVAPVRPLVRSPAPAGEHEEPITVGARAGLPRHAEGGVTPSLRRRLAITLAGVALLAGLIVTVDILYRQRNSTLTTTKSRQPSVAVLPLQNLSGDPASDYFSDGMSEEISTKLSRIQTLTVAPYSSTARLKATLKSPEDIARELQVRYLLDGSVRKAGNQVKVNVRLFDASTGFQIWADDFVGDVKNVFTMQEQAATKIAEALNLHLSQGEKQLIQHRYTQNPEAYEAYLQGRALLAYGDEPDKIAVAETRFEQALKLDPEYALALAGYSYAEGFIYRNVDSDPTHLDRAEQLARRALSIDPQLPEAHVALGYLYGYKYDYPRAAQESREALRSQPQNDLAWDLLAWALGYETPPDALGAEKAAREGVRLGPFRLGAHYVLGRALCLQGRYDEARVAFEKARELSATSTVAVVGLAQLYLAQGDSGHAVGLMEKVVSREPKAAIDLFWLASAYSAHRNRDKALATMKKAFDLGFRDFAAIDASPHLATLRVDPRFQQLIREQRR